MPRAEQVIGAERLAGKGLVGMLHPDDLSAGALGRWMAGPLPAAGDARQVLDLGGLDRTRTLAGETLFATRHAA